MQTPKAPPPSSRDNRIRLTREFEAQHRSPKGLRKRVKGWLTWLPSSHYARLLSHWPDLRLWRNRHITAATPVFESRYALFDHLIENDLPPRLAYLEFGCASGEVVTFWADRCPHPEARFWGFDTFTGMPEEWRGLGWTVKPGAWSQNGDLPVVEDTRVAFVKGRFQDSLEEFVQDQGLFTADFDHFVIHIDADLYSAALYVLCVLRPLLPKATVLFDEFDCVLDELKALDDFCRSFDYSYTVLATADSCEKIAIRFDPTSFARPAARRESAPERPPLLAADERFAGRTSEATGFGTSRLRPRAVF